MPLRQRTPLSQLTRARDGATVISWRWVGRLLVLALAAVGTSTAVRSASTAASGVAPAPSAVKAERATPPSSAASVPSLSTRIWMKVPRVAGRLQARDLGLVVNTEDPYSVQVGEYYARARGLQDDQILKVSLPVKGRLTREEFADLSKRVEEFYGDRAQALALAWRLPYGVECNSITGALTMGFDASLCAGGSTPGELPNSCSAPARASPYFASASSRPLRDHRMRLSMLLAAPSVPLAKAMIDRGVRSDDTLGLKNSPTANIHFVTTSDEARSVRRHWFPPAGPVPSLGLNVSLDRTDALKNASRVLIYQTGRTQVDYLDTIDFLPGALADHLTSFGGMLDNAYGQMNVLAWIEAGATASYGTTSEPCSHWQKFPHPQAVVLFYTQGATAIETYWKSVAWPQQGLFVGEPLAAPFDRSAAARPTALR